MAGRMGATRLAPPAAAGTPATNRRQAAGPSGSQQAAGAAGPGSSTKAPATSALWDSVFSGKVEPKAQPPPPPPPAASSRSSSKATPSRVGGRTSGQSSRQASQVQPAASLLSPEEEAEVENVVQAEMEAIYTAVDDMVAVRAEGLVLDIEASDMRDSVKDALKRIRVNHLRRVAFSEQLYRWTDELQQQSVDAFSGEYGSHNDDPTSNGASGGAMTDDAWITRVVEKRRQAAEAAGVPKERQDIANKSAGSSRPDWNSNTAVEKPRRTLVHTILTNPGRVPAPQPTQRKPFPEQIYYGAITDKLRNQVAAVIETEPEATAETKAAETKAKGAGRDGTYWGAYPHLATGPTKKKPERQTHNLPRDIVEAVHMRVGAAEKQAVQPAPAEAKPKRASVAKMEVPPAQPVDEMAIDRRMSKRLQEKRSRRQSTSQGRGSFFGLFKSVEEIAETLEAVDVRDHGDSDQYSSAGEEESVVGVESLTDEMLL